jgi:hypothetical protein
VGTDVDKVLDESQRVLLFLLGLIVEMERIARAALPHQESWLTTIRKVSLPAVRNCNLLKISMEGIAKEAYFPAKGNV